MMARRSTRRARCGCPRLTGSRAWDLVGESSPVEWRPGQANPVKLVDTETSDVHAPRSRRTSAAASARRRIRLMRSAGSIWSRRDSAVAAGSLRRTASARGRQPVWTIAGCPDSRPSSALARGSSWAGLPNLAGGAREASGCGDASGWRAVRVAKASPAGDRGRIWCRLNRLLIAKRYTSVANRDPSMIYSVATARPRQVVGPCSSITSASRSIARAIAQRALI